MKKSIFILVVLSSSLFMFGQQISWDNFNERAMDTVMFNVMNSYLNFMDKDPVVWSPVVQKEILTSNYELISNNPQMDLRSLHNQTWPSSMGLPDDLKDKIIEENVNPAFLDGQKYSYEIDKEGNTEEAYGTFDYGEILVSIPTEQFSTYQEIANHAIHSWNNSNSHSGIMNANYNKKVIVGTITFYHKSSQRVFISFVYIS